MIKVAEGICPQGCDLFHLKCPAGILDKSEMGLGPFHCYHRTGSPGGEFIGYAAGSGEKVQYLKLLKIIVVGQDIKQAFFGKVGGGSGFELARWANLLSFEYAADYTHLLASERIMKRRMLSLDNSSR